MFSIVLSPSYLAGRPAFSQYLEDNPWSARREEINIFRSQQQGFVPMVLKHYFYNLF